LPKKTLFAELLKGAVANPPFLQLLDVVKPLGSRVQLFEKVDLQQPLKSSKLAILKAGYDFFLTIQFWAADFFSDNSGTDFWQLCQPG
jgi:hypothetical protein